MATILRITSVAQTEGTSSNDRTLVFTLTLSEAASSIVRFSWLHQGNGTANDIDLFYGTQDNTGTIAAGATSVTLSILLRGDSSAESDEGTLLQLFNLSGAEFENGAPRISHLGVIQDDDGAGEKRALLVAPGEVVEDDGGTRQMLFSVKLSRPAASAMSFDVRTLSGSAEAGSDFTALNSTLSFAAGQTEATVAVTILGDSSSEADERFTLQLTPQAGSAALLAGGAQPVAAVGVIADNDAGVSLGLPELSVRPARQIESNGATNNTTLNYQVVLSEVPTSPVRVSWLHHAVPPTQGTGSESDLYYQAQGGTITIQPGQTSFWVQPLLRYETTVEPDEGFVLELYNVSGAVFAGGAQRLSTMGIVLDDDGAGEKRALLVSDAEVLEGQGGQRELVFLVQLSRPAATELRFDATTLDGTARAGSDYTATTQTLVFAPGQTEAAVRVPVSGDTLSEAEEYFSLRVVPQTASASAIGNGVEGWAGMGRIVDDDGRDTLPTLTVRPATQHESDGATSNANLRYEVVLSEPASGPVRFTWYHHTRASSGSARATDADLYYGEQSGTITLQPGQTTFWIEPLLSYDTQDEADESVLLELYNLSGAVFAGSALRLQVPGFILDDDGAGENRSMFVSDVEMSEGASGSTQAVFVVRLTRPAFSTLVLDYTTVAGSALAGSDFEATSGTLTFSPGQTEQAVAVNVFGDALGESGERFSLIVTPQAGSVAAIANAADTHQGTATLLDDDADSSLPEMHVYPGTVVEGGNNDYPYLNFQVVLSAAHTSRVSVSYFVHQGTASWSDLYSGGGGETLNFEPGQTVGYAFVRLHGLDVVEPDESWVIDLYNPSGAVFAGGVQRLRTSGFVLDDDGTAQKRALAVSDVELLEGADGSQQAVFTVRLSRPASTDLLFDWRTIDGTAQAGSDYGAATGTLTMRAGQTEAAVFVDVLGDTAPEAAETFTLLLTPQAGSAAAIGNGADGRAGLATIVDDDASAELPEISVAFALREQEGQGNDYIYLEYQVVLNTPAEARVTVDYVVRQGTAFWTDIYSGGAGRLTFEPGQTVQYAFVRLQGDTGIEPDESFVLDLYNPAGAVFAGGVTRLNATAFILDDDGTAVKRALFVEAAEVMEGAAGTQQLAFKVLLSRPAATELVFDWRTIDGTAVAGSDYTAATGTLSFAAGQTEAAVFVEVVGDTNVEAAESFTLLVTPQAASAAAIGNGADGRAAVATIVDDDTSSARPELHVIAIAEREGGPNDYPYLEYIVALNEPASSRVTVSYAIRTATTDWRDTYSGGSGTLTFEAGETMGYVWIRLQGDANIEPDESFVLELYNPAGAVFAGGEPRLRSVGFLLDDDGTGEKRSLIVSDVELLEGESGTRQAAFKVLLSRPATTDLVFDWRTIDGSAVAGSDYTAANGTLTLRAGQTEAAVLVDVLGDTRAEAAESFTLLVTPQGGSVAAIANGADGRAGMATIADDDTSANLPELHAFAQPLREGHGNDYPYLEYQVVLSEAPTSRVTVEYLVRTGTSDWRDTYSGGSGTLTFEAGQTTGWVSIRLQGDTAVEPDESFVLELFNAKGAVFAGGAQRLRETGFALDDDGTGEKRGLFVSGAEVLEGAGGAGGAAGTRQAAFTVQLSRPATSDLVFDWRTADGTAVAGRDYTAGQGTLSFAAGQTEAVVFVDITGDTTPEAAESFTLVVAPQVAAASAIANGAAGRGGVATILDDDTSATLPEISVLARPLVEGHGNDYPYIGFQVNLNEPATTRVTVQYIAWGSGSATIGAAGVQDIYQGAQGTLTFEPGETTGYVWPRIQGDALVEPDEFVTLFLSSPVGAVFPGGVPTLSHRTFLLDDDGTAEKRALIVSGTQVLEGASGSQEVAFVVQLSRPASTELVFDYRTVDVSARAGSDYTAASGVLRFAPGQIEAAVVVQVSGDLTPEPAEAFLLLVTPQAGSVGAIGNGVAGVQGTAALIDDDTSPSLPVAALSGALSDELSSGGSGFAFGVTLNRAATSGVRFDYRVVHGTTVAADLSGGTSGSLSFAAGETSETIFITVNPDTTAEADETFFVEVFNPVGAVFAGGVDRLRAAGVIVDDDGTGNKLALIANDARVVEGNEGNPTAAFVLQLSRPSATAITINYQTADGTATAGSDYTATGGSLTFAPGQTLAAVHVPVNADLDIEGTEAFRLVIAANTAFANATATVEATGTILTDDTQNPPTGSNDRYTAYSGLTLSTSAANGVLVNDNDIERDALTTQLVSLPTRGALTLNADGSFSYTPQAGFVGTDSFSYRPLDNFSSGSTARVIIDVRPASEAPGLVPQGAAFTVNGVTTGLQYAPAVAALSNGNFIAVWVSRAQDGGGDGVYAQLLNSSGAKVGSEFRINTTTAGHQQAPAVAAVGDGFVVAWDSAGQDGSLDAIVARRFLNNGTAAGTEVVVNAATDGAQVAPALLARADGSLSVAWQGQRVDGVDDAAWLQVLNNVLARSGSAAVAAAGTQLSQGAAQVLTLVGGGSVLLWHGDNADGSGFDVYAQRFGANQAPEGAAFRVNSHQPSYQTFPAGATLAGGSWVVVWSSYGQDGGEYGIYGQRYNSQGQPLGAEFQVNTTGAGAQERPAVAALADGGFAVAWAREAAGSGVVELQRFSSLGVKLGGVVAVDGGGASLRNVELVTGTDGGVLLVAESASAAGAEVVALRFAPLLSAQAASAGLSQDLRGDGREPASEWPSSANVALAGPLSALPDAQVLASAAGPAAPTAAAVAQTPAQEGDSFAAAMKTGFGVFLSAISSAADTYSKLPTQAEMKAGWTMFGAKMGAASFAWNFGTSTEKTNDLKAADAAFKAFNGWAGGAAAAGLTGIGIGLLATAGVALAPLTAVVLVGGAAFLGGTAAGEYGLASFRAYEEFSQRSGQQLADFLRNSADTVGTAFSDAASSARTALETAANTYGPRLEQAWESFQQTASRVGDQMAAAVDQGVEATRALWETLKPQLEAAQDAAVAAAAQGFDFVTDLARDVGTAGVQVLERALDAVSAAIQDPPSLEIIRQAIADLLGDLAGRAADVMRDVLNLFGLGERSIDPIVLDLDGDGAELIALTDSTVRFDMDADGFAELTAWVSRDDGLLVLDRNLNGSIDDISELLGSADIDGFAELEIGDTNRDGSIDSADPVYGRLRIWRDADSNGRSDAGELSTLAAAGIVAISVRDVAVSYQIAGNLISAASDFQRSDGSIGLAVDAWFRIDQLDAVVDAGSSFNQPFTLDPETLQLPMLRGYGEVPDLYVAMSLRPALKSAVITLAGMDASDHAAVRAQVAQILYLWADQAAVDSTSRGRYVDARQLETLEAFTGETYRTARGDANPPTAQAGNFVGQAWEALLQATMANLLVQTGFSGALAGARYDVATDSPRLVDPLAEVVTRAVAAAPADANEALGYWKVVGPVLDLLQAGSDVSVADYRTMKDAAIAARNLGFNGPQLDNAIVSPGFDGARLDGSSGDEVFLGSAAGETFNGGQGSDSYLLGPTGWGDDRILEVTSRSDEAGSDTIVMPRGMLPNQVTISRTANGFELQRRDTDDRVVVETVNLLGADGDFGIETIQFSNGVVWQVASMLGSLSASAGADSTVNEAAAAQTFTRTVSITDPVDNGAAGWAWRVNWSDGVTSTGTVNAATRSFDITRTYADSRALEATVTVTDDVNDVDTDRFMLNVLNVAPTLSATGDSTIASGASYTLQLSGSDVAGVLDPLTYRIDWGDGSAVQVLTAAQLAAVAGRVTHVFQQAVARTIVVTADDGDGGLTNRNLPLTVAGDASQTFSGTDGRDRMPPATGSDSYFGGAGDDVIEPGLGADTINGGDGYDIVSYAGLQAINANLQASTVQHGGATDTLLSVEALFGSAGNDTITGANASGGLSPNARQDTLRGGAGNDTIDGGTAVDTAEFTGPRAGYTVTRSGSTITVTDIDPSNGNEGTDTLSTIERLMFADVMLAFGTRAEELARVAFVLWTPAIAGSTTLFARGYSYYDVGYDFAEMSRTALNFWPQTGDEFAQILVRGTPGTSRSVADVLAIMNANGGPVLGRAAAVQTMAMDPATTASLEASGVLRTGVVVAHDVPGFGTLFDLLPG